MDPAQKRATVNAVVTFEINDEGLIEKARGFWGLTDFVTG
jgi:hypothetical protein